MNQVYVAHHVPAPTLFERIVSWFRQPIMDEHRMHAHLSGAVKKYVERFGKAPVGEDLQRIIDRAHAYAEMYPTATKSEARAAGSAYLAAW